MSANRPIEPQEFAEAFQRLTEHFGEDPATYPLMTETVAVYDLPNIQLAPLPDADSRSRLLDLFGRGLDQALSDRAAIVAETEGVSPAFLRELVRKAALHAARAGSPRVEDAHFREALDLLERGARVTRAMLGADGGAGE